MFVFLTMLTLFPDGRLTGFAKAMHEDFWSYMLRPMLMAFMFQTKIFQNIDEGGRSSLSIMPLFLEAK